jgi:FkbM family methyltransferase
MSVRSMAQAVLGRLPAGTAFPVLSGPMRGQRWIVAAGNNSCWLGTYEQEKQRLLQRLLRRGDVFYDLGAHTGLFTLLGARLAGPAGRVVAFEPNTVNVVNLRRHLALNKLNNVVVVEAAVSNRRGQIGFAPAASNYMGRLDADGTQSVAVTTLDDFLTENQVPPPNVIKLDIEGAEADALRGAAKLLEVHHPKILVAAHSPKLANECRDHLTRIGYSCAQLIKDDSELVFTHTADRLASSSS